MAMRGFCCNKCWSSIGLSTLGRDHEEVQDKLLPLYHGLLQAKTLRISASVYYALARLRIH